MNKNKPKRLLAYIAVGSVLALLTFFILMVASRIQGPEDEVKIRLKWLANAGFIGELYADNYGIYVEEGLDVKVLPGGPEKDAIRDLELGNVQFAVASADQVIRALAKGADIVVLAQIYQKNPVQWIYRRRGDKKYETTKDLVGAKVGITIGDNDEMIMKALLRLDGVNEDALDLVSVKYSFAKFVTGELDLFPVYVNTQGVTLERDLDREQESVDFFDPEANGVSFVANSLVTSGRLMKAKPKLVESFVTATLRGWATALDPNNEALTLKALERHVEMTTGGSVEEFRKELVQQIRRTRKLVVIEGRPIGRIDSAAWRQTEEIMVRQGLVKEVAVEGALNRSFVRD